MRLCLLTVSLALPSLKETEKILSKARCLPYSQGLVVSTIYDWLCLMTLARCTAWTPSRRCHLVIVFIANVTPRGDFTPPSVHNVIKGGGGAEDMAAIAERGWCAHCKCPASFPGRRLRPRASRAWWTRHELWRVQSCGRSMPLSISGVVFGLCALARDWDAPQALRVSRPACGSRHAAQRTRSRTWETRGPLTTVHTSMTNDVWCKVVQAWIYTKIKQQTINFLFILVFICL